MNTKTIELELNGRPVQALEGETLLELADRHGVAIPRLCHKPGYRPDGNCRACMVEIDGERVLAPSCCRTATEGMKVHADSPRAVKSQNMVLEMLLSDTGPRAKTCRCDRRWRRFQEHAGPPQVFLSTSRLASRSDSAPSKLPQGSLEPWASSPSGGGQGRARPRGRSPAAPSPRPTCRTRRWRSTSMPAFSATAACVPAAKSRSTTSSATPFAAITAKSCSTCTTPWATAPAWPAASACKPAPRARSCPRPTSARRRLIAGSIRSARSAAWAARSPTT
ncbi:MAG: hypothetical protein B7X36_11935 [Thiomonas sp. 14-64-326]|nr:MAG: hypothetical protein B7X36_11935 [Thiomonas sp. 14-64-326]